MILKNFEFSGLTELMKQIFDLDNYYASKGKSDQTSSDQRDRVQLGANANSVLSFVTISFLFENMTVFDIETMKKLASSVKIVTFDHLDSNPTPNTNEVLKHDLPDVYEYIHESDSIINDIKKNSCYPDDYYLYPIGGLKLSAVITFKGKDILVLFNGFLENYIYSKFRSSKEIMTESTESKIRSDTFKALMEKFMSVSYQSSQKPSLIEDYLINKEYFSYIKNPENGYSYSMVNIIFPTGKIQFYGSNQVEVRQGIDNLQSFINGHNKIITEDNIFMTVGVSSTFLIYMMLKLYGKSFNIIANEKYDIPFSDKNVKFQIPFAVQTEYGIRINKMINHNLECRDIVIHDEKTYTNLSHPSNRYGMIFIGQKIRYLIQVSVKDIKGMGIEEASYLPDELYKDAAKLISDIRSQLLAVEKNFIHILSNSNKV